MDKNPLWGCGFSHLCDLPPWHLEAELLHAQLGQQFVLEASCSVWLVSTS